MSVTTLLIIILILILLGALPAWPHSAAWGWTPSSVVVMVITVIIILALLGRV